MTASIEALAVLLDDQVPPEVEFVKLIVEPTQTPVFPEIAAIVGSGVTVTLVAEEVAVQPF